MKRIIIALILLFHATVSGENKVYGWLEHVYVGEGEYRVKAKLDSGAKTSSLHVLEKTPFTGKDGKEMIKFKVQGSVLRDEKRILKTIVFTKPVNRVVKIKSSNGSIQTRYAVILPIMIGDSSIHAEFTLSNRAGMNYPVLLGRSTISQLGLIDSSQIFLQKRKS